jgi:hypothetical protein
MGAADRFEMGVCALSQLRCNALMAIGRFYIAIVRTVLEGEKSGYVDKKLPLSLGCRY